MPTFTGWKQLVVFVVALGVLGVNQFLTGTDLSGDHVALLAMVASLLDILFPKARSVLSKE